jgi:hypothetical protein
LPFAPDAFRLEEMKKYDPEMYELEVRDRELESQTQTLAQQLRRAPLNERAELKKQLQELVDQHFDARPAQTAGSGTGANARQSDEAAGSARADRRPPNR